MTPWVRRLIVANVLVFVAEQLVPGLMGALAFRPILLFAQPWTIVTSLFAHASILHIVFNMLSLYWFGPKVEERLGGPTFLGLYFASGIGGGLLSFMMPLVPIVGASGAIMGIAVAFAMYWPRDRFYFWGAIPVDAWLLVLIYVLVDLAGAWGIGGSGIAHLAHLGGAATAYIYLKVMELRSPARRWRRKVTTAPAPGVFGEGDQLKRWRGIRLDDLHPINRDEVLRLLEKIQRTGPRSLTPEERATLDRFAGAPSA